MEEKKKDKRIGYAIGWTILNAVWWLISIGAASLLYVDVNPFLNDAGEIALNGIILMVGLAVIYWPKEE